MSISERLKQVLDSKKLNIKAFSEQTEIPYRSVQNYLREEREPNAEALVKIYQALNVNINWLLTGEGSMFQHSSEEGLVSTLEENLLSSYRTLPDNLKETIMILCKEIATK